MNKRIVIDFIIWAVAAVLCMLWRWVADKSELAAYWAMFGALAVLWVLVGLAVQLYRSYKETWLWQSMLSLVVTSAILVGACHWGLPLLKWSLSPRVATWAILIVGAIDTVVIFLEH